MNAISSQYLSAALHVAFLLLCFTVPIAPQLDVLEPDVRFERWVRHRVKPDPPTPPPPVVVRLKHDPRWGLGGGVGSTDGATSGSSSGPDASVPARAPQKGPSKRQRGPERDEPSGSGSAGGGGSVGDDEIDSEKLIGELVDGASGGGGKGHAKKPDDSGGFGGASSGCGCMAPATIGTGMGIGGLGRGRRGAGVREIPQADLGEYVPSTPVARSMVIETAQGCDGCRETIQRIVRSRVNEIKYCYENELKGGDPSLDGELLIELRIGASGGEPTSVAVTMQGGAPELEACAKGKAARWFFPPLGQNAAVSFPILLLR